MGVTVREKPKGSGVWWVFISQAGQRRSKRVGVGTRGRKLAEDVAVKIRARLLEGDRSILTPSPEPEVAPLFAEAAQQWLARYRSLFGVRDSTLANRRLFIERHLAPFFAGRRASAITTELVEDFIAAKRATGGSKRGKAMADSTLKVNLPTLRMILDYCVRRQWMTSNPPRGEPLAPDAPLHPAGPLHAARAGRAGDGCDGDRAGVGAHGPRLGAVRHALGRVARAPGPGCRSAHGACLDSAHPLATRDRPH